MTADFKIAKLTNELEDAGELGLLAAALLSPFLFAGPDTGAFSGTDSGFVWSKTMGGGLADRELPFLIGKIKVTGSFFSATVGVQLEGDRPAHINLLFSFLGEDGNPQTVLEIYPSIAVLADKIQDSEDPNRIVGYQNPGDPFQIPLPMAALEFNFHLKEDGLQSALVWHESISNLSTPQACILEAPLDKVIVFPKMGNVGLYVDSLFVDFTNNASTNFAGLFPEVYDPSWKGFGAKDITFLYPVEDGEFIFGGAQGFLYGLDKGLSGNFNINYSVPNTQENKNKLVRQAVGEVEIRNNQFVKSQVAVDLNMKRLLDSGEDSANQQTVNGTADETSLAEIAKDERTERQIQDPVSIPDTSVIRCQATFVWHELEEAEVLGIDLIMTGISLDGSESGLVFTGPKGRRAFWAFAFMIGLYYLTRGVDNDNYDDRLLGLGLLTLFVVSGTVGGILPEVDQFTLSQLGFRLIHVNPKVGDSQTIFEVILGFRARFKMNGALLGLLEVLGDKLQLEKAFNAGSVFGANAENIRLAGHAEIEVSNIYLSTAEVSPNISRLFERKDVAVKATKLPELKFDNEEGEPGTALVPKIEFVTNEMEDGRQRYGLGIYLDALTGPSVSIDIPATGLIFYFFPELEVDFATQLAKDPGFTFLIPKALLATGKIELSKPIPSFKGDQSRISVDVGILPKNPLAKTQELLKVGNYKMRFNGEVAWGNAVAAQGPGIDYDFYFVQVGYAGQSPLFSVGPVGLFGLDLIYGKNIAPGFPGNRPSAVGIANWILNSGNPNDPFQNVRDWPSNPSSSTWHPDIIWDSAANEYKTQRAAGFIILAGSAHDKAESVKAEVLGLAGLDEFWLAVAAKVKVKPANLESIAIFAYDSGSYLFRLIFEFRINAQGKFVQAKVPLEIGSSKNPHRGWLYVGHYDSAFGGPVLLDFFKRFKVKFFLVYDTAGLQDFGLMPIDAFAKPDIMGEAYGAGAMFQLGPYKFGPSFLNVKLFAAMGVNAAYGKKPHMLVGELYAGGYIQLKVIFFKFKLELLTRLQGMAIEDAYRWLGQLIVKLNLPWPFDDIEKGFDFVIQSNNFVPLPKVEFETTASALGRLEAYSRDLFVPETPVVPIDSVISVGFNKPLYEILDPNGAIDKTTLHLNDSDPNNDKISEQLVTDYQDLKYIINYVHAMHDMKVTHQPIGGGAAVTVNNMLASWEVPDLAADGTPIPGQSHHKVLYLNTLFPPELQFNIEQLGAFNTWESGTAIVWPCMRGGSACTKEVEPRPELETDGKRHLTFPTILDDIVIKEDKFRIFTPFQSYNIGRLDWETATGSNIVLPYDTYITLPHSSNVRFGLNLFNENLPGEIQRLVRSIRVQVVVDLRGVSDAMTFSLHIAPDSGAPCGWKVQLLDTGVNTNFLSVALTEVLCNAANEVEAWIEMEAKETLHLIQAIRIKGHDILLDGNISLGPISEQVMNEMLQLSAYKLRLINLCIQREQLGGGVWENTDIGGSPTDPADEAIDTFIENQLMEPNREYTVNYDMHTFAQLYHDSPLDGTELVNEIDWATSTTPTGQLRTVRFRTEAEPSQDVSKYLGFVYPSARESLPYADSAVPMITFKYRGLIRKIYEKHGRILKPRLLDMNGNEIETTLDNVTETHSGGFDQALENLLEQCLPHLQTLSYLKTYRWAKALVPNMRYSLQLTDDTDSMDIRIPFNTSFQTSRYPNFAAHADAVVDLLPDAGRHAVADSATAATQIAAFMQDLFNGVRPGFDGAVEQFYRDILSQDGGRLGSDPTKDYMTFIVGLDPADLTNVQVWGAVFELAEPLLGKESVMLSAKPDIDDWLKRGVTLTNENYLILRDSSASRVIVLNSGDGQNFAPFDSDISLSLNFVPEEPLRQAIASYVALTFPDKTPGQQASLVAAALASVKNSDPDTAAALTGEARILQLTLPED